MITQEKLKEVKRLAVDIRRDIVNMLGGEGHVGHLGGSCSSADIVALLYGHRMKHDPKDPQMKGRDKFLYSKGHAAIAQYAALAEMGYFGKDDLPKCKTLGCHLQGHPDRIKTPGIEAGTGSLGQGLSIACGMALAKKLDQEPGTVYCVVGDGELAEGQIWEAAMAASNFRLDNIVAIVDHNKLQATGPICERFVSDPLPEKWEAFGWHVLTVDGHDMEALDQAFDRAAKIEGKPTVIIADTVKGKGISFAEHNVAFHNGSLTKEQYEQAHKELDDAYAAI